MMTQTCRGCGQPLGAGVSFCPNCGVRADGNGAAPQPVVVTQPVQAVQPVVATAALTTPFPAAPAPVAVAGQPAPAPVPADQSKQVKVLAAATAVVILLAAAAAFMWPSSAQGDVIADQSISASGGKVKLPGGGEINVPKDAVAKTERIVVRKTAARNQVVIPEMNGIPASAFAAGTLPIFWFGPNITFLRPVTIVLTVGPRTVAVRVFVIQNGRLRLVTVIPTRGGVVRLTVSGFQNGLLVV